MESRDLLIRTLTNHTAKDRVTATVAKAEAEVSENNADSRRLTIVVEMLDEEFSKNADIVCSVHE